MKKNDLGGKTMTSKDLNPSQRCAGSHFFMKAGFPADYPSWVAQQHLRDPGPEIELTTAAFRADRHRHAAAIANESWPPWWAMTNDNTRAKWLAREQP